MPYKQNIDQVVSGNVAYRRVLHTTPQQQLVAMNLRPGVEIGGEHHDNLTQFFYIIKGSGYAEIDGKQFRLRPQEALVVPPGAEHNVWAGPKGMKLLTIYTPPEHPKGLVQMDK